MIPGSFDLDHAGFTLVELVVVVAVLGLLAALSFPSLIVWKASTDLKNAAAELSDALLSSRTRSIVERSNYTVRVDYANDSYAVTPTARGSRPWGSVDLYVDNSDPDCPSFSGGDVFFRPNSTASPVGFEAAYLRSKNAKVQVRYRVKVLGATAKVSIERWLGGAWVGAY